MSDIKTAKYDMKSINKDVLSMIIPISLEGVLQMVVSTVLMAMIGRIDVLAVNAVGVGTRITQLIWSFARGISIGATVVVARDYGANKRELLRANAINTLVSLFLICSVCSILIFVFSPQIVGIFGGTEEMMSSSIMYMRIVALGLPFWSVLLVTAGVLQGLGNAKTPMILTSAYNILSISIGYILIFGKLGIPSLGIAGAGWALVISQIIMFFISLATLYKLGIFNKVDDFVMTPEIRKITLKGLYRVGLPTAFENMLWQLGSIAMMAPIISYGDYAYAAHQMAMQAESISYMPTMGFAVAATSLIGRSVGSNDYDKAKIYYDTINRMLIVITVLIVVIILLFPRQLMSVLTPSPEIITLGASYLIITAIVLLPQNLTGVYCGSLRGVGYSNLPMYIAFTGLWLIRVPLCYISAYLISGSTIHFIWIAMAIDNVARFIISKVLIKKKDIFKQGIG